MLWADLLGVLGGVYRFGIAVSEALGFPIAALAETDPLTICIIVPARGVATRAFATLAIKIAILVHLEALLGGAV